MNAPPPSSPSRPSPRRRITGVTIPLFSLRTERSWGIGEIADLPDFADWMLDAAGIKLVQILPLGEISGGETSPYSALTAFGIDPLYISWSEVPELAGDAAREALGGDVGVGSLEHARAAERVDYGAVRYLKTRAARFAFERFRARELANDTPRAQAFHAFVETERSWLEDYALFRALKDAHEGKAWWDWSKPLAERDPEALAAARTKRGDEVRFFEYLQWVAHTQWEEARARLHARGVEVMGDLPFMVGRDSADVWANKSEFRHDASVGVPPDMFNAEGQDWGLPPYNWQAMRANDFAWLRRRARYSGALYDRFRIDHLVGFYRTFTRPAAVRDKDGKMLAGAFDPAEERAQLAHGERVLAAMKDAARERHATIVAEDLGIVPDWVRASLTRLEVPGYKVLIWEKDDAVFRDPAKYPALAVACFGTHDTDPVAVWWETRDDAERKAVLALPRLAPRAGELATREFTPAVHRALLDEILGAPSELVLLLVQDVLATRERVNTPATVGPQNWSYRLPAVVSRLRGEPGVQAALATVRAAVSASER